MAPTSKSSPVLIVGAGVFGLSTSIHLAQRGYQNIRVLDTQPEGLNGYRYTTGNDAASADINKIIRCSYGEQTEYQNMSLESVRAWSLWNAEFANEKPNGSDFARDDHLFLNNGNIHLTNDSTLPSFELTSKENMAAIGLGHTQIVTSNAEDVAWARRNGFDFALDPFPRSKNGKHILGLLDATGGTAFADKACLFAIHKAKSLGVRFLLGSPKGKVESFVYGNPIDKCEVTGVSTKDGHIHKADLIIIACGAWTPSLVPELDGLCEATAGSMVYVKIPPSSSLFERFAPENFPTWTYKMRDGSEGGLYGFPRDQHGNLKIGYRGTKYTNPLTQSDSIERSVPITRWTIPESQSYIPRQALGVIKNFIAEFLPELGAQGLVIDHTRMCWYTDTFDNHFLVDHVPTRKNLVVATGGSGHAFMYLPILGKYIVDVIEGKGQNTPLLQKWAWRKKLPFQSPVNVLMEGSKGSRAMGNVEFCQEDDFNLQSGSFKSKL